MLRTLSPFSQLQSLGKSVPNVLHQSRNLENRPLSSFTSVRKEWKIGKGRRRIRGVEDEQEEGEQEEGSEEGVQDMNEGSEGKKLRKCEQWEGEEGD